MGRSPKSIVRDSKKGKDMPSSKNTQTFMKRKFQVVMFFINFFNEFANESIYTSQNSAMCGNSRPPESSSEQKKRNNKMSRQSPKSVCNAKQHVTSSSPKKISVTHFPLDQLIYWSTNLRIQSAFKAASRLVRLTPFCLRSSDTCSSLVTSSRTSKGNSL